MFESKTNYKEFKDQIEDGKRALYRVANIPSNYVKYWPIIRREIKKMLVANLENLGNYTPSSTEHLQLKEEILDINRLL